MAFGKEAASRNDRIVASTQEEIRRLAARLLFGLFQRGSLSFERRVSSECLADRSRYFFARRWRRRRALCLLAGRVCPSGLGRRLVYQAMRAFWRAAISEEHANCVGEIILWCHC